jgi:hypothetical protein
MFMLLAKNTPYDGFLGNRRDFSLPIFIGFRLIKQLRHATGVTNVRRRYSPLVKHACSDANLGIQTRNFVSIRDIAEWGRGELML